MGTARPDAHGPALTLPRLAVLGLVAALAVGLLARSPLSPVALLRADQLLAEGLPIAAARHLDAVRLGHPLPAVRDGARDRLITLFLTELNNPVAARDLLTEVAADARRTPSERAHTWERLARLLHVRFNDLDGAAEAWRMAYEAEKDAPAAVWRRAEGLQLLTDAGRGEDVFREWENLQRDHPEVRAVALLNLAQIELGRNLYGNARERFRDARAAAPEGSELYKLADEGVALVDQRFAMREDALARAAITNLPERLRKQLEKASRNAPLGEEDDPTP